MARNITLTLGAGLGADLGPNFNLTANVGSVTPSTATKTELLAGKSVSVDDLATQITVTSTGTCTDSITQIIPCATTSTTTSTTSTTSTTTAPSNVDIFIDNNNSLDIPITGMTIGGVAVTYSSGQNFTIPAGNNGNFTSSELGTKTVTITYGSHIPGQNITFVDSASNITCKDLNGSAGSFTIVGATITGGTTIYVTAADGACV